MAGNDQTLELKPGQSYTFNIQCCSKPVTSPPGATGESIRISAMVDTGYSLTARNGGVVFAPSNPTDKYQRWTKYPRDDTRLTDSEGLPCFSIVNQATWQAIQYTGPVQPVSLVSYNPDLVNESTLWTEKAGGQGFYYIRTLKNVDIIWDAFNGDKQLQDGIVLGAYNRNTGGSNQLFKNRTMGLR